MIASVITFEQMCIELFKLNDRAYEYVVIERSLVFIGSIAFMREDIHQALQRYERIVFFDINRKPDSIVDKPGPKRQMFIGAIKAAYIHLQVVANDVVR